MPIKAYFKGEGSKVMASMKKKYGEKKGESVFYATANKQHMKPPDMESHLNKMKKSGILKKGK